ncbi:hypothetical protein EBZ37_15130, partial [bacterium]|nr:hypothetical protein [bacterium]
LTSTTPNNVSVFQSAVRRLGTEGSYEEEGFEPLLQALRRNPNFVRPNSTLALIFLTDAKEQGNQSVSSVVNELSNYKGIRDMVSYGIFWTRDLGCGRNPGEDDWSLQGSRYGEFVKATAGKTWALCTSDFGKNLAELGKDLVSRLTAPRLFLDSRPRSNTLRVLHHGKDVPAGLPGTGGYWYFDQELNAIIFHDLRFAPGDDEEVEILYDEDNGID